MSVPCDSVHSYADGLLPSAEADDFCLHLHGCARCQAMMENIAQLRVLGARYLRNQQTLRASVPSPMAWLRPLHGLLAAAACVMAFVVWNLSSFHGPGTDFWTPDQRGRSIEARVSDPRADRYRKLHRSVNMGGAGSEPGEPEFYEKLGLLTRKDDNKGAAAAFLVRAKFKEAQPFLRALPQGSADTHNDNAVVRMYSQPEQPSIVPDGAVDLTTAFSEVSIALELKPDHPQALWNRAILLREFDLQNLAADTFEKVASLHEPGWETEARERASELRKRIQLRQEIWKAAEADKVALLTRGEPPEATSLARDVPIMRLHLYDAIRSRTSAEEVLRLRPYAKRLDGAQNDVLTAYVYRIAKRNFLKRRPLAEAYGQLLQGKDGDGSELITQLRRSGEDDILIGALVFTGAYKEDLAEFERLVRRTGDPWFELLLAQEKVKGLLEKGKQREASDLIENVDKRCSDDDSLKYRCLAFTLDLATYYLQSDDAAKAMETAKEGLKAASWVNEWDKEFGFLQILGQAAWLRNDIALSRAYLDESSTRGVDDDWARLIFHQYKAAAAIYSLKFKEARGEIDLALALNRPLTLNGAYVLADLSRHEPRGGDDAAVERALSGRKLVPSERAFATHIRGRLALATKPALGRELLRQAIEQADAALETVDEASRHVIALRARTYSYTSLILDAGRAGTYGDAWALFGEYFKHRMPDQCALAATAETERTLLIARGASGKIVGRYQHEKRIDKVNGLVPDDMLAELRPCEAVEVRATPPLYGRADLLPIDFAWSYKTRSSEPPAISTGKSKRLVIANVAYSSEREKQQLSKLDWIIPHEEGVEPIEGPDAISQRVLASMIDATEIEFATHGSIDIASGEPFLVLAKDKRIDQDTLTAAQIRAAGPLKGAPLVILAACYVAKTGPALHKEVSLPAAFIEAGARAVLAATKPIDKEFARRFFDGVRARIQKGASPVTALRDEKISWVSPRRDESDWLNSVLLFE